MKSLKIAKAVHQILKKGAQKKSPIKEAYFFWQYESFSCWQQQQLLKIPATIKKIGQ